MGRLHDRIARTARDVFDRATIGHDQGNNHRLPAAGSRYRCILNTPGYPCCTYARVTITDLTGATARSCVRHAIDALEHIDEARVDWDDSKGLNEYEIKALQLTEASAGRPRKNLPMRYEFRPIDRGHQFRLHR